MGQYSVAGISPERPLSFMLGDKASDKRNHAHVGCAGHHKRRGLGYVFAEDQLVLHLLVDTLALHRCNGGLPVRSMLWVSDGDLLHGRVKKRFRHEERGRPF